MNFISSLIGGHDPAAPLSSPPQLQSQPPLPLEERKVESSMGSNTSRPDDSNIDNNNAPDQHDELLEAAGTEPTPDPPLDQRRRPPFPPREYPQRKRRPPERLIY